MNLQPVSMRRFFLSLMLLFIVDQYSALVAAIPAPAASDMVVPETASETGMMQPRASLGDKRKNFKAAMHHADSAADMHDAHASIFGYSPAPKTAMIKTSTDSSTHSSTNPLCAATSTCVTGPSCGCSPACLDAECGVCQQGCYFNSQYDNNCGDNDNACGCSPACIDGGAGVCQQGCNARTEAAAPAPPTCNGVCDGEACLSQDNSECANDGCYRTTRYGNYQCCGSNTFFCYSSTSGDCKADYYYCNGYLGH